MFSSKSSIIERIIARILGWSSTIKIIACEYRLKGGGKIE
jgi:hypothetical protein